MLQITYAIYAIAFFFFVEKMYKQLSTLNFLYTCRMSSMFITMSIYTNVFPFISKQKCFE